MLSIGGCLTLIKAFLSNLPMYVMSLFKIPKVVAKNIAQIQRRFLWCGCSEKKPFPPIKWSFIELPKLLGGLSVGILIHRNIALLFKGVWR